MRRAEPWRGATARRLSGNVGARGASMVVLAVATLLVAHAGGPAGVGEYAMVRVLTGLVGVAAAMGLPTACTYFLAAPDQDRSRVASTVTAIALVAGSAGALAWVVVSPVLKSLFFDGASTATVALAATTVLSQLLTTTARSSMQGTDDLHGSNVVFVLEEIGFLPVFPLLAFSLHLSTFLSVVVALLASDLLALGYGWRRLLHDGFLRERLRPSPAIGREIVAYGSRAQLGGVLALLNLRLDFVVLGLLTGPAVVGVYGVASKFAELLRVPPLALTYVLYPRFARDGAEQSARAVRRLLWPAFAGMAAGAAVLAAAAPMTLRLLYGPEFHGALKPALVLLVGMLGEGVSALVLAYFYGVGRPGLNSLATGVGLAMTVVLDLTLIPVWGAVGAAVASSFAYGTVDAFLLTAFVRRAPATEQALRPEPVHLP